MTVLDGYVFKGSKLKAFCAKAAVDPMKKKVKAKNEKVIYLRADIFRPISRVFISTICSNILG